MQFPFANICYAYPLVSGGEGKAKFLQSGRQEPIVAKPKQCRVKFRSTWIETKEKKSVSNQPNPPTPEGSIDQLYSAQAKGTSIKSLDMCSRTFFSQICLTGKQTNGFDPGRDM